MSLPLSTLTLRALSAQRAAYPSLFAAPPSRGPAPPSGARPLLPPPLAALHGLPPAHWPNPSALPHHARAASRMIPDLPPTVGPGRWALPSALPPKIALRLCAALALRLPAHMRQGLDLPQLLEETLRQLGRNLAEHPKTEEKTWPALQALAPAVAQCVAALVGERAALAASPAAQREALAAALVTRFLHLLGSFKGDLARTTSAGPSHRMALAHSLCAALPPAAAQACAPALAALGKRLGEEA